MITRCILHVLNIKIYLFRPVFVTIVIVQALFARTNHFTVEHHICRCGFNSDPPAISTEPALPIWLPNDNTNSNFLTEVVLRLWCTCVSVIRAGSREALVVIVIRGKICLNMHCILNKQQYGITVF